MKTFHHPRLTKWLAPLGSLALLTTFSPLGGCTLFGRCTDESSVETTSDTSQGTFAFSPHLGGALTKGTVDYGDESLTVNASSATSITLTLDVSDSNSDDPVSLTILLPVSGVSTGSTATIPGGAEVCVQGSSCGPLSGTLSFSTLDLDCSDSSAGCTLDVDGQLDGVATIEQLGTTVTFQLALGHQDEAVTSCVTDGS